MFGTIMLPLCIVAGLSYLTVHALTVTLQVYVQLLPENIGLGDTLTISVNVTDYFGTPIDKATVSATIGDLEIRYNLAEQGNGHYEITIDVPIVTPGTYDITVRGQKDGFNPARTSDTLTLDSEPI